MREKDDQPTSEGSEEQPGGIHDGDGLGRKSRTLVRIVAGGFLLVGFMDLGAYWLKCHQNQTQPNPWHLGYLSIPLLIGVVILIKTSALARLIEDWLEQ